MAGLNDPSMDVRVEAMKAMRSVLMEGLTGKERDEVGANLAMEAFKVCGFDLVQGIELMGT